MTKQKLWFKKRTTRGGGREVRGKTKLTPKNITREVYKNQRWYSHFLLKFVVCALVGLVWLQVGLVVQIAGHGVSIFPLGALLGLIVLTFEKVVRYRWIELAILAMSATLSFIWPVGLVL